MLFDSRQIVLSTEGLRLGTDLCEMGTSYIRC